MLMVQFAVAQIAMYNEKNFSSLKLVAKMIISFKKTIKNTVLFA